MPENTTDFFKELTDWVNRSGWDSRLNASDSEVANDSNERQL